MPHQKAYDMAKRTCHGGYSYTTPDDYDKACGKPATYVMEFNRPDQGQDSRYPLCDGCVGRESMRYARMEPDIIPIDEYYDESKYEDEHIGDIVL